MGPNRVQQHAMLSLCLTGKSRSCEHVALHNSFAILGPYWAFCGQVFITTRTLPFFSSENIALYLPLEDGARHERKLLAPAPAPDLARIEPGIPAEDASIPNGVAGTARVNGNVWQRLSVRGGAVMPVVIAVPGTRSAPSQRHSCSISQSRGASRS